MIEFISVVYLLLPILAGSILHGIIAKFNWFKSLYRPIDFGLKWREKPIFGKNKTYKGLLLVGLGTSLNLKLTGSAIVIIFVLTFSLYLAY